MSLFFFPPLLIMIFLSNFNCFLLDHCVCLCSCDTLTFRTVRPEESLSRLEPQMSRKRQLRSRRRWSKTYGSTLVCAHAHTHVCVITIIILTLVRLQFEKENLKIPGMLIIDTPGHESFRYHTHTQNITMIEVPTFQVSVSQVVELPGC